MHALLQGIAATKEGKPVLLEFITTQDKVVLHLPGRLRQLAFSVGGQLAGYTPAP